MNPKTADTDVVQTFNHFLEFDPRRVFGDESQGFKVKACGDTTFQHMDVGFAQLRCRRVGLKFAHNCYP